ncbi:MAG: hypothetical protein PVI28_19215 [Gammaproteobacteria bacterium]|jgi:hypothetical protein
MSVKKRVQTLERESTADQFIVVTTEDRESPEEAEARFRASEQVQEGARLIVFPLGTENV